MNAIVDEILRRIGGGEKLLAHSCAECNYPCGYVMRGGHLLLDKNCWCLDDLMRMSGKAIRLATREEIEQWITDESDARLRRLILYCDDRSGWTPENWAEYIGAT